MKVYHEGKLGHQFLFKGFEYIVFDVGRKKGKWKVHFLTLEADPDQEFRTRKAAIEAAEKIIVEIFGTNETN